MSHNRALDSTLFRLLLIADIEMAAEAQAEGCACGGVLHSARYPRKPRGGSPAGLRAKYSTRESLCCAVEGCRKRVTPPSLRFLGRRVYLGAVVVLVSAMTGGVTEKRAAKMRDFVGVSIRTLSRWRAWWLATIPRTVFWKGARGRFAPPVEVSELPESLLSRFAGSARDGLLACLRFLSPITIRGGCAMTQ